MTILAIDPGNVQSAFCAYNQQPLVKGMLENYQLLKELRNDGFEADRVVIEMIASYGMPVGREVFETCLWIGRFTEAAEANAIPVTLAYRKDIKIALCGSAKAKDGNIRQALIDRIGPQGTKKAPGPTYGFKKDEWAALAVAVYYADSVK